MSGQDFVQMNRDIDLAVDKIGQVALLVHDPERAMRETSWSSYQVVELRRTLEHRLGAVAKDIAPWVAPSDADEQPSLKQRVLNFIPPPPPDDFMATYLVRMNDSFEQLEKIARLVQDRENAVSATSLGEDQVDEIRRAIWQGTWDIKYLLDRGAVTKSGQEQSESEAEASSA